MRITVNGERHEVSDGCTVAQLLSELDAPERGIAVARNEHVVRRAAFAHEPLAEGDRIEIIQAVAGG